MKKGKEDLVRALKDGIGEVEELMGEIKERLLQAAEGLRVEQDGEAFQRLSGGIENLRDLIDFFEQVKEGLTCLGDPSIPQERLLCWDRSVELFQEMLSAFERKDWITVADIIEYELKPVLEAGREGLREINLSLKG